MGCGGLWLRRGRCLRRRLARAQQSPPEQRAGRLAEVAAQVEQLDAVGAARAGLAGSSGLSRRALELSD